MWCWCHRQTAFQVYTVFPLTTCTLQSLTWYSIGTAESHVLITTGAQIRHRSSNTAFNHVSDCSVQCMNRTGSPQPSVTRLKSCHIYYNDWKCYCQTNKDAPAIAVQDRDKLTNNRTEQALCNRPMYIIPTVQHKQRKSLKGELKPRES